MPVIDTSFDPDFASPVEWALMYRGHGVQVVPSYMPAEHPSWKRPALADWIPLQKDLAPDFTFARWYGESGEHRTRQNMGLVTGLGSGNIFMIDLDTYKGPAAANWWHALMWQHNGGQELKTWRQTTGGGGRQIFFRAPSGWTAPTNKVDELNVDIRGQGGFAVLPPSLHSSGKCYAWDKGYAPYEGLEVLDAPRWLLDAIDDLVEEHGGQGKKGPTEHTPSPGTDFDAFGNRVDGREEAMRDYVWAVVVDWWRECPIKPPDTESYGKMVEAYEVWERGVKSRLTGLEKTAALEREDRGPSAFARKWRRAMRLWDTKVAKAAKEPKPKQEQPRPFQADAAAQQDGLFEFLDVVQIKAMRNPEWLIDGLTVENALGFIFGAPGGGKTFIALSQALSLAVGMGDWFGRSIQRQGPVLYISSEGQGDLKFRIAAWEQQNQVQADPAPFFLIRQTINFMSPNDVNKLIATIEAIKDRVGIPVAVYVDTVSRVLPGADENLQKDMTLFIRACDEIRQRYGATVVGVHHTSRNGNLRGSTVFDGAGDFLLQVDREEGAETGELIARKIKAAEDGWRTPFRLEKVALPFGQTSLVAVPCEPQETVKEGSGWPDKPTCRIILKAIGQAWQDGVPWSPKKQTIKEGRYAARLINVRFSVPANVAEDMIQKWQDNNILAFRERDKHSRIKGLEVCGSID